MASVGSTFANFDYTLTSALKNLFKLIVVTCANQSLSCVANDCVLTFVIKRCSFAERLRDRPDLLCVQAAVDLPPHHIF